MNHCAYKNCYSTTTKDKIKFFDFPANAEVRKQWYINAGIADDVSNSRRKKLCQKHFLPNQWNQSPLICKLLRPDCVPFPFHRQENVDVELIEVAEEQDELEEEEGEELLEEKGVMKEDQTRIIEVTFNEIDSNVANKDDDESSFSLTITTTDNDVDEETTNVEDNLNTGKNIHSEFRQMN